MSRICDLKCVNLDKRMVLESVTRTSDTQGGFTETWATVSSVWVQLKPMNAYEKMQFAQNATPANYTIMMRYRAGVTNKMRFTFDARVFYIKEVIDIDDAHAYLKIKVMEMI